MRVPHVMVVSLSFPPPINASHLIRQERGLGSQTPDVLDELSELGSTSGSRRRQMSRTTIVPRCMILPRLRGRFGGGGERGRSRRGLRNADGSDQASGGARESVELTSSGVTRIGTTAGARSTVDPVTTIGGVEGNEASP